MEDDVKNLFQKIGKPVAGYQEINRTAVTEQARKRWPLLRDVNIHSLPGEQEQEFDDVATIAELPEVSKLAPTAPTSAKHGLHQLFKADPVVATTTDKSQEVASGFFNRLQAKPEAELNAASTSVSSLLAKVALPSVSEPASQPLLAKTAAATVIAQVESPGVAAQQANPVGFSLFRRNELTGNSATAESSATVQASVAPTSQEADLHAVFNRLAGKQEVPAAPQAPKSFFNKIFKS